MDIRFGTWNLSSPYRAGSLMTVAKQLSKYKLDLVGIQEVRWDNGSTEPAGKYTFLYGKGNENFELGTFFHMRIISAVTRVESVGDMMSYIILRQCSYDIIILNVHAPTEDKIDGVKGSLSEGI
jgi:hypothetical protein